MPDRQSSWFDLFALLAGASLPLAFAPLGFYPLAVLIPLLMFYLWQDTSPRLAFRRGYLFGLGMFGVGVSWVYIAIGDFGFTSAPVAVLLTSIFICFLALFPAVQGYLTLRLTSRLESRLHGLSFVTLWLAFEWFRGWVMTGFPWLNLGYSQIDAPLAGYAPLVGVYGLSLLSVLTAMVLWRLLQQRSRFNIAMITLMLAVWAAGPALRQIEWTTPVGQTLRVGVVQANLPQITKWDPDQILSRMNTYADLSEPLWEETDLIVWPENALTILWQDAPLAYQRRLEERASQSGTSLVIGTPSGDIESRYYSSMLVLGRNKAVYHKRHLVPFGEYVPLPEFMKKLAGFFNMPMSGFSPGDKQQAALEVAGQKMAPTLCYEDAFGEELIDFLPEATVLINGSNNAWYGRSWAAAQHLQIARMRALETGRESIRATTTGISALLDHKGGFIKTTRQHEQAIMIGRIQPYQGATPYVDWGNYPVIGLMLLSLVGLSGWALYQRNRDNAG